MLDMIVSKVRSPADYSVVARMHMDCINQGFLPTLGERFLTLLYEAIDADSNSALFLAYKEDGQFIGFTAGGQGLGAIYRQMIRRAPSLLRALFPALLNPAKLKRIVEIIWFSRQQKPIQDCPKAELFSIAVSESARGDGVADRLYQELAKYFQGKGDTAFCIVVGNGLAPAHRFYLRMGAVAMAQISVHHGAGSTLYRHDLKKTN